jgi:hypothetical protein
MPYANLKIRKLTYRYKLFLSTLSVLQNARLFIVLEWRWDCLCIYLAVSLTRPGRAILYCYLVNDSCSSCFYSMTTVEDGTLQLQNHDTSSTVNTADLLQENAFRTCIHHYVLYTNKNTFLMVCLFRSLKHDVKFSFLLQTPLNTPCSFIQLDSKLIQIE